VLDHVCQTHHAIGAVGPRTGRVRVPAVVVHMDLEVRVVLSSAEQRLQGLDVADGVPEDLHLREPLVGVGGGTSLQCLKRIVDFAQSSSLPHGRGFPAVRVGGLPLAGFARPEETPAGLVVSAGRPDVLVLVVVLVLRL